MKRDIIIFAAIVISSLGIAYLGGMGMKNYLLSRVGYYQYLSLERENSIVINENN